MTNPKSLLDRYGLEPKKGLGKNFRNDPNVLEKIVASAEVTPDDTVLEIGPGTGALTEALARHAKRVIAVEIDERFEPILRERLEAYSNVEIVFRDILQTDVPSLVGEGEFIVVANVPYYITSAIIRHLLDVSGRPKRLVLTMQVEVAERLVAKPNDMSLLAVSAQYYGAVKIVMHIKAGAFWPRPEVDSAVVRLDTYAAPAVDVPDDQTFFRVVKAGFSQKRKQLKNSLGDGLHLSAEATVSWMESAGIDPRRRAETLTLAEWGALARKLSAISRLPSA
jgi:16S rRNA (adenine1518-N6/adenine1519-N6)-dimethyltransferase